MRRSGRGDIHVGGWSESVICEGWLADNPKKERKKQLVRCVVRQTKERKETSNNNLTFAASLKEKKEELASQQICSEEIDSGK